MKFIPIIEIKYIPGSRMIQHTVINEWHAAIKCNSIKDKNQMMTANISTSGYNKVDCVGQWLLEWFLHP